jgi:cysteine desulfurase/selenocysteine lyase
VPPPDTGPPLPRHQIPVASRGAYLDTAYASPLPVASAEAMAADAVDAGRGTLSLASRFARVGRVRAAASSVLGFGFDDVALVPNTTHGLGVVAAGLDWRPGDVVLVPADDHPTTVLPWRAQAHRGVVVRPVPLSDLASTVLATPRTRVVALSWVQAHDGTRTDLAPLASVVHSVGALLCVDAIQGAGVIPSPLADWGVDAAAAGSQKWLLGPHGIGALAVTPSLRSQLAIPWASKGSVVSGDPFVPVDSAARFEAGAPSHTAIAGWAASLDLLGTAGIPAVWAWVDRLATRLASGCADLGLTVLSPGSSALVSISVPGLAAADVVSRLADADVIVSARGDGVRLSPAGWNDDADVDAALAALAAL